MGGVKGPGEKNSDEPFMDKKHNIVRKLKDMNSNMRSYGANVGAKLQAAYKDGNYKQKFGYDGAKTANIDEIDPNAPGADGKKLTAFEKMLHKDDAKLNRLQAQAKRQIEASSQHAGSKTYKKSVKAIENTMSTGGASSTLPDLIS